MNLNRNLHFVVFKPFDGDVYRNYYGLEKIEFEVVLSLHVDSKKAIFRPVPLSVISNFYVHKLNSADLQLNYIDRTGYENRLFLQF
jgi:hypothetical protein